MAGQFTAELLAYPSCPAYLKDDEMYTAGIMTWAQEEGERRRLRAHPARVPGILPQ